MPVTDLFEAAKAAAPLLGRASTGEKNAALDAIAGLLLSNKAEIVASNQKDLEKGKADGIAEGLPPSFADAPAIPKFRQGGILLAHAGGGAGLFSSMIGGWVNGGTGSDPVSLPVTY